MAKGGRTKWALIMNFRHIINIFMFCKLIMKNSILMNILASLVLVTIRGHMTCIHTCWPWEFACQQCGTDQMSCHTGRPVITQRGHFLVHADPSASHPTDPPLCFTHAWFTCIVFSHPEGVTGTSRPNYHNRVTDLNWKQERITWPRTTDI